MSIKVWCVKDYPGHLINQISANKGDLPKPLPWIEPSINNLYLEACSSFLYGNYFSSIVTASLLLEHTLRLAVVDKNDCGLNRTASISEIDSYGSLSAIIDEAKPSDIFSGCNEQWWIDTAKCIRNKSAHYLLPVILRKCMECDSFSDYFDPLIRKKNNDAYYYEKILTDWGAFYHKDDRRFAKYFLKDVYEQLLLVISNTNWVGDESWWKSQKEWYDLFFEFDWTIDNVITSISNAYKPFGKHNI